jgi:hypothetical protein
MGDFFFFKKNAPLSKVKEIFAIENLALLQRKIEGEISKEEYLELKKAIES